MAIKKVTPKLEINDDVNFIRFAGRVYSLNDIGKCAVNDVIETAKSHFEAQANAHTEGLAGDIAEIAHQQEREQLEHLRAAQASNVCTIRQADFKRPIVAYGQGNNSYSLLRFTHWNPTKLYFGPIGLSGLKGRIQDTFLHDANSAGFPEECFERNTRSVTVRPENLFINTPLNERWKAMCLDIAATSSCYHIVVDSFIPAQVLVMYFDGSSIRFIPTQTRTDEEVHPHCMSGMNLCTGGQDSKVYWENPAYAQMLQTINFESLATHMFMYTDAVGDPRLWNLYYNLMKMNILSINREETTSWRTRRTS